MKYSNIAIAIIAAALVGTSAADAKSYKRGVGENQFSIEGQMTPLLPGVTWYYNWGQVPGNGYQNQVVNFEGLEYVSMSWNNVNADALRKYVAEHPGVKYILGFNEPNFTQQANMTPQVAAERWPAVQAIAKELGLKIVAPALNYSPNPPYTNPTTWMDEFVKLVGPDAFDFTAVHNYGGVGVMKSLCTEFHERYGKPVWVTEFCNWPGGAGDVSVAPSAQIASMIESVQWLEQTDWIYRYAWFKPIGAHNSNGKPNYGLEISENGLGERQLSPQGWVYVYMSEFDKSRYYGLNETVAASDYVNASNVLLEQGANEACPRPIEISQFNAGAYADWQFDVPKDGDYNFTVTVSGIGEPVRFDPSLKVVSVAADGTATDLAKTGQFTLPGDNTVYVEKTICVSLKSGRQTIRLQDVGGYMASGIRISTVKLTDAAGVDGVSADTEDAPIEWFNLQGMKISGPISGQTVICRQGTKTRKILVK